MKNRASRKLFRYGILIISLIFSILLTNTLLANPKIHWAYIGEENPTTWGELSPDFITCSIGQNQSPINFEKIRAEKPVNIAFNYQNTPLNIINNGHTIQVNYSSGSTLKIDKKEYELIQFHFHTPSEHTIDGQTTDMELHLVHKNPEGEIAVIGLLIKQGQEHPLIKEIWKYVTPEKGEIIIQTININAINFIPQDRSHYHYIGSLTTPPCTEGVNWIVLTTPLEMSSEQISQFAKLYQMNARPIQPHNQREIVIRK